MLEYSGKHPLFGVGLLLALWRTFVRFLFSLWMAIVVACAIAPVLVSRAQAQETQGTALPPPEGPVILTVTGQIGATNAEGHVALDVALLTEIGLTKIDTNTIWTSGVQHFEGVLLADFIAAVGAKGSALRATALNDYAVEIPLSDAVAGGPILAFRMNGVDLSPRDKGPIWIVYPYDQHTDYQTEVIYSRSIWQLDRIEVLP